jgi:hypothetical protein
MGIITITPIYKKAWMSEIPHDPIYQLFGQFRGESLFSLDWVNC